MVRGQQHLGLGAALGGDEVAAVDHRSGQGAVVDHRSRARAPSRAGVVFEQLGGVVAEKLEGGAPLDQGQALGDQAFQLDRADFRCSATIRMRSRVASFGNAPERPGRCLTRMLPRHHQDVNRCRDGLGHVSGLG